MNQGNIIQIGMLIIFLGIIVVFIGTFLSAISSGKSDVKYSVVGLLGFIPFGISNDKKLFYFSLIMAVILIAMAFLFFYRLK